MATGHNRTGRDPASEAMQRALEAEEQARAAIEGCQTQAEQLREQARTDADRIQERADRRADWVHRHCETVLQDRLEALATTEDEDGPAPWTGEDALAAATEALAAALTRTEPPEPDDTA